MGRQGRLDLSQQRAGLTPQLQLHRLQIYGLQLRWMRLQLHGLQIAGLQLSGLRLHLLGVQLQWLQLHWLRMRIAGLPSRAAGRWTHF
jgi:hypothetical protein